MKLAQNDHTSTHTAPIPAFDFLFAAPEKRQSAKRGSWLTRLRAKRA